MRVVIELLSNDDETAKQISGMIESYLSNMNIGFVTVDVED